MKKILSAIVEERWTALETIFQIDKSCLTPRGLATKKVYRDLIFYSFFFEDIDRLFGELRMMPDKSTEYYQALDIAYYDLKNVLGGTTIW